MAHLPLAPRPILQLDPRATILIAGQASGRNAHEPGARFDDPSGERLRLWLGIDRATFCDPTLIAILPMGLCLPGTASAGDLPPRPECAPAWRGRLLALLPRLQLTLVIGSYTQAWQLNPDHKAHNVTDAVGAWRARCPGILPLPHPSPRDQRWLRSKPWFEADVLPNLRTRVRELLQSH
jgi:uracil-DNA glycosylase